MWQAKPDEHDTLDQAANDRIAQAQAEAMEHEAAHAKAANTATRSEAELDAIKKGGSWQQVKAVAMDVNDAHTLAAEYARKASAAHIKAANQKDASAYSRKADQHLAKANVVKRKYSL